MANVNDDEYETLNFADESEWIDPGDCRHAWVSGMMYVHPEDLHVTALARAASGSSLPECERCELVYDPSNPPCDPYDV